LQIFIQNLRFSQYINFDVLTKYLNKQFPLRLQNPKFVCLTQKLVQHFNYHLTHTTLKT